MDAIPPSEYFRQAVEEVGVGVGIYGTDGRLFYVNPAFAALFETTTDELTGTPLWELVPEFDESKLDAYLDSFETGETRKNQSTHRFNGIEVPVRTVTTCESVDGHTVYFGTVRDVTDQRERQEELLEQNRRLTEVASVLSHDLRNPLNIALGYLDILGEDIDRRELDTVASAIRRMEQLIDDVLVLARPGTPETDTNVEVDAVAISAWQHVETGQAGFEQRGGLPTIEANPSRLKQLFENLFRNAVEHNADTSIRVTVGPLDDGFYVADDGQGIDTAVRESLLDVGTTTAATGTGLGLSIVRRIAENHGWQVTVTDSEAGGARFEFRFE